jgi:hypothetical protein
MRSHSEDSSSWIPSPRMAQGEFGGQPAYRAGSVDEQLAQVRDSFLRLRIAAAIQGETVEAEVHRHQRLPDVVVQGAREAAALFFVFERAPQREAAHVDCFVSGGGESCCPRRGVAARRFHAHRRAFPSGPLESVRRHRAAQTAQLTEAAVPGKSENG